MLTQRFLKLNNGKIFALVYEKPTYTDQSLDCSSRHQKKCKESIISCLFNRAYLIITNKDDITKENATKKASAKGEWISRKHYQ